MADTGWGWMDRKGRRHPCDSFEELEAEIVKDAGAQVDLVWTPASDYLLLPEELSELRPAMTHARIRWAEWDMDEGRRQMILFGLVFAALVAYSVYSGKEIIAFGPVGLALLLFLILGAIPWYQGHKRLERVKKWGVDLQGDALPELRFETWLMHQKAPLTRILLVLVVIVGLFQWLVAGGVRESVGDAGLVKSGGLSREWWRMLTATFLHGHWIHLLMNAAALHYLGKRMEVLARWPHVAMVFLIASWVGWEASLRFSPGGESIGASGGLLGMLGFLLVFEWLHRELVPESARRRLLAGLIMTGVIGVVFPMIDNAAHLGGLVAGMIYAFIVFPQSDSAHRPREFRADRVVGVASLAVLVLSAAWACLKMAG